MRSINRLLVLFPLFVATLSGSTAHSQTTTTTASHSEDEDLRQTVASWRFG